MGGVSPDDEGRNSPILCDESYKAADSSDDECSVGSEIEKEWDASSESIRESYHTQY